MVGDREWVNIFKTVDVNAKLSLVKSIFKKEIFYRWICKKNLITKK
jgi:hypothetical protein